MRTVVGVCALAWLLAGCQAPSQPNSVPDQPVRGGTVVWGFFDNASNLNPIIGRSFIDTRLMELVSEGLTVPDPYTGAPSPLLAESWSISPDGLTYTFKLREGVRWHDGRPFTAEDVKFTYEAVMDRRTVTNRWRLFEQVKGASAKRQGRAAEVAGITVLDPHTLRIELEEVYCPFLVTSASMGIAPKHLLEGSPDINSDPFNQHPIGTGRFRFKEWVKDHHVTLAANDDYWGGRPHLDAFVYKVGRDSTVLVTQLRAGEIDIAAVRPELLPEVRGNPDVSIYNYAFPSYQYIGYNPEHPVLQDKRVRQALTHALDREKLIERVFQGEAKLIHSASIPYSWAYDPEVRKFPYDPTQARALLLEAGYRQAADGTLRDPEGRPVRLRMFASSSDKVRESIATVAREQFRALGLDVEVRIEDAQTHDARRASGDWEMLVSAVTVFPDPDEGAASTWSGTGSNNYKNPEAPRLLREARTLPGCDQEQRKTIYSRFQRLLAEEQPYNFAFVINGNTAVHNRFKNVKPSSWGYLFWNIQDWYSVTGR